MIDTTSGRIEDDRAGDGPKHDARRLTDGGNTATIVLDGQSYVLRITRTGKLILTK
ncbi:hemin uptake protein HemP [Amaricoccus macauensis]|uniref:hemin uptake protein HemP n=1 Tax=Amaricoccus macauensis TaxID=57001 RepID=UPI003C7C2D02